MASTAYKFVIFPTIGDFQVSHAMVAERQMFFVCSAARTTLVRADFCKDVFAVGGFDVPERAFFAFFAPAICAVCAIIV